MQAQKDILTNIPRVSQYEAGLYTFVEDRFPDVLSGLQEAQEITPEIEDKMKKALEAYDEEFKETI